MIVDCHAHLDHIQLQSFLQSYENIAKSRLGIISNSVSVESSKLNLALGRKYGNVTALVGIHPEIFSGITGNSITEELVNQMCDEIANLSKESNGLGEIGLDPKYGSMSKQLFLLERQLHIAESNDRLVLTLHTRGSISVVLEELSRFNIRNKVLFHWFSGTEMELKAVQSLGYFVSFGLTLLYSRRLANLVLSADQNLLLVETDSPLILGSITGTEYLTPFAVASVVFSMAMIKGVSFNEMQSVIENNANNYLERNTH